MNIDVADVIANDIAASEGTAAEAAAACYSM